MADEFDAIRKILAMKTIAVVGLSGDPQKDSYKVALYMKNHKYKIVPVNPTATEVLNEVCYPSLVKIPGEVASKIDAVLVFRKSEDVLAVLMEIIELHNSYGKVKAMWLSEGIQNDSAKAFCQKAGLLFVQNRCMKKERELL
ncbi:MAG: CoA-binding protein [Candidatus Micrarchaeota archaeon]